MNPPRIAKDKGATLPGTLHAFLEAAPDGIVLVDGHGRITVVNRRAEEMFGYERAELIGQEVEILVPVRLRGPHAEYRDRYSIDPRPRPIGQGQALAGRRKNGTEFPVEISLSALETQDGRQVISIIRDITDRREAERQLQASLREKEVLLKEIHHRVKNNLQVTSSLLRLQSGTIQDERAREALAESQHRIRSMALVHEKLYRSRDLARVDLLDYTRSLATLLMSSLGTDERLITLTVVGNPVFLGVDAAIPCGLIVNELLTNCLKHAFPPGKKGEIEARIMTLGNAPDGNRFLLSVRDNGVGMPGDVDARKEETLGLRLVSTLVDQLHGTLEVERGPREEPAEASRPGTEFRVFFSEART
ncbi:MAG: PAS domain S-box protein [Deltaproteobacteria bacterium]|nr:PAS domain S-box protein [Deltaproteobacteria bacterium]